MNLLTPKLFIMRNFSKVKRATVFLLLILSLTSCSDDEIFIEPEAVEEVVDDEVPTEAEEDTKEEEEEKDITLPCDFSLSEVKPNSTVIVDCEINLEGNTVNLPSGVTLVYEGGKIENGTINFSGNTTIDGELLNNTIKLGGTNPILKDNTFRFSPERWGIVEGKVTDPVALENKKILQDVINKAKEIGVTIFEIDRIDAFFKVSGLTQFGVPDGFAGIFLPSDFDLRMTENTFLRVQPNNLNKYKLFLIANGVSNVSIKGGNLVGDRDEHDYSQPAGDTHEFGYLIQVFGASNVVVDGVHLSMATGDGIIISEKGHAFDEDRIESFDIVIKNCIIDLNRRNNISVTAGHDIIIENNQLLNVGQPTSKSKGTSPRFAIDIEAVRSGGRVFEEVYGITIRNNVEKNSFAGAFIVHTGDDVTIENNDVESVIAFTVATGVKVLNNRIIAPSTDGNGTGIQAGGDFKSKDNVVSGNTIRNHPLGIVVSDESVEISNNTIENYTQGIKITNLINADITNNRISKPLHNFSIGIVGWGYADNLTISDNYIDAGDDSVPLQVGFNSDSGQESNSYTVENNTLIGNSTNFRSTKGLSFVNNVVDSRFSIITVSDSEFKDNTITMTFDGNGFYDTMTVTKESSNIVIASNTIYSNASREDINAIQITDAYGITLNDNKIDQQTGEVAVNIQNARSFEVRDNVGNISNSLQTFIKFNGQSSTLANNLTATGEDKNDIVQ
jgi:hypothetical protein